MNESVSLLPAGFAALEPFVEPWAISGTAERALARGESVETDRTAFYSVARTAMPTALTYLDGKPLHEFDERERRLMNLMLMLCHVSLAVELQGSEEGNHRQLREHMKITRSSADKN